MKACPNCLCSDVGTILYKCSACDTIYCAVCSDFDMGSSACPDCGLQGNQIGEIDRSDDRQME